MADDITSGLSMQISHAILVETKLAQKFRSLLERELYWDDSRQLKKTGDQHIAIPVNADCVSALMGQITADVSAIRPHPSSNPTASNSDAVIRNVDICKDGESGAKPVSQPSGSEGCSTGCHEKGSNTSLSHHSFHLICDVQLFQHSCTLIQLYLPPSKKSRITTPHNALRLMADRMKERRMDWTEEYEKEIPRSWEMHGDMVVLPQASFRSPVWENVPDLWPQVARALDCQRVARRGRITLDDFRTPTTELVLGSDPTVTHRDNGITYTFDVRYSMFSAGNVTEKLRVAGLDCSKETVVDLYAGIGYFTLPYLVHAKARLVYACEWNPHAIAALSHNLSLNGVSDRCVVLEGDNRKVCPKGVADRVNLGLIPSSEEGWPTACAALKPNTGGILHIHGNVTSHPHSQWNSPGGESDLVNTHQYSQRGGDMTDINETLTTCNTPCAKWKNPSNVKPREWREWAMQSANRIAEILAEIHMCNWEVEIQHIERVKSYAPRIDHLVLDLACKPAR